MTLNDVLGCSTSILRYSGIETTVGAWRYCVSRLIVVPLQFTQTSNGHIHRGSLSLSCLQTLVNPTRLALPCSLPSPISSNLGRGHAHRAPPMRWQTLQIHYIKSGAIRYA